MKIEEMTNQRLAEIEARVVKATAGPWIVERTHAGPTRCDYIAAHIVHTHPPEQSCWDVDECPGQDAEKIVQTDSGCYGPNADDAEFIAHARTDIPDLLAEVNRLRRLNAGEPPVDLLIRCHGCNGTVIYKRKSEVEWEFYHNCPPDVEEPGSRCPKCGDIATYQTPDGVFWDGNAHYWRIPAERQEGWVSVKEFIRGHLPCKPLDLFPKTQFTEAEIKAALSDMMAAGEVELTPNRTLIALPAPPSAPHGKERCVQPGCGKQLNQHYTMANFCEGDSGPTFKSATENGGKDK